MPDEVKKLPLRLLRDSKGEIRPIGGISPTLAIDVEVIPITYGQSRNLESFGEALYEWSDEDKLLVLQNHLKSPELDIRDVEDMHENFDGWVIEDLVQAVFFYSGMGRLYGLGEDEEAEGNVDSEASTEEQTV